MISSIFEIVEGKDDLIIYEEDLLRLDINSKGKALDDFRAAP